MPFLPVQSEKIASAVVRQIEDLILRGILRPGERLPSERELAERLDVSRPSLRDAFADLQEKGLLVSKPGAGVFIGDVLGSAFSPALQDLMSRHEDAIFDVLAFRRDMEGLAVERAARQGSDTDLAVVQEIIDRMTAAHRLNQPEEEALLDAKFHMAIVEASHNVMMLHMMRSLFELWQTGVFYNRQVMFSQSTTREALLAQHSAINTALQSRDAQAARAAMDHHFDYVHSALLDQQKAEANEKIARQRLDQAQSRK